MHLHSQILDLKFYDILKEDLARHLFFWKEIYPKKCDDFLKEVKIAIYEFQYGEWSPEVEESLRHNIKDRIALESISFAKIVQKNWKTTKGAKEFLQKLECFHFPRTFLPLNRFGSNFRG